MNEEDDLEASLLAEEAGHETVSFLKNKKLLFALLAILIIASGLGFYFYMGGEKGVHKKVLPNKSEYEERVIPVPLLEEVKKQRYFAPPQEGSYAHKKSDKDISPLVILPAVDVNILGKNTIHKVSITIGVILTSEEKKAETTKVQDMLLDNLVSILGMRKIQDVLTPAGRILLKEDLSTALSRKYPNLGIKEVIIIEFLTS